MTKIRIIIDIILFLQIESNLYLSLYVEEVNDCVYKIQSDKNFVYFEWNKKCVFNDLTLYPNDGKPIIMNKIYTLRETINVTTYNIEHYIFIKIYVTISTLMNIP